ncbi:MAG: helix-turn-helix domain containing protein [Desulfomonile tiedjei]|uniref:Helix-turn-helix domain containing protein n=1 Tax=Desulfomonile tiedjei TaxID=2358 RepID=A0A9D6VAD7_9BACT|nr:helix-turn-helix domain containing protein [Desulfomonile tiedjei]
METWVRAKTIPQRVFFRARICLLAADGFSNAAIAQELHTCRPTVSLWKKRFEKQGPDGLTKDAPRGPSSKKMGEEKVRAIMEATLYMVPPDGDRWTTRTLAKAQGVSNATVARIWKANGFKPQRRRTPQTSRNNGAKLRTGVISMFGDSRRGCTSKKPINSEDHLKKGAGKPSDS